MDTFAHDLMHWITERGDPFGFIAIALSAMIEYVFPPFPGDMITLFAAILITAYGWSFIKVFGAVMAGSIVGSLGAFYLGRWLRRRRIRRKAARAEKAAAEAAAAGSTGDEVAVPVAQDRRALLDRLVAGFERHGAAYLVINRFLPGVRALFFVAAGMADMRPLAVVAYSAISAAAWNLAIIALGSAVGANFDALALWVERYTTVAWVLIAAVVLVSIVRYVRKR